MDIWRRDLSRVSRVQQSKGSTLILCSLFLLGSYETRRDSDTPKHLLRLLKPDCVDLVWYLGAKLSIQRPEYLSNERDLEFDPGAFITSYRILVSVAVGFLGSLKTIFAYSSFFTDAIWVEWLLAGIVSSSCVNFNLAQVNQMLNYKNPSSGSISLVYMKTTR
jgi:hypothetical protein